MDTLKTRIIGQLTILSAVATIVSLMFLILFFSLGGLFGPLNDLTSIFQVGLMLPVLYFFWVALRPDHAIPATIAAGLGLLGISITAIVQLLLVVGLMAYPQTIAPNMVGGGLIGVWLILANALAMRARLMQGALPWLGTVSGLGYMLVVIGFSLSGQDNLLFQIGGGLTLLSYPIWAIWLGSALMGGKVVLVR